MDNTHLVETTDDAGPVAGGDGSDVDDGVGEDGPLGWYPRPAQPVSDHRGEREWTRVDVNVVHAAVADVGLGGVGRTRCTLTPCLRPGCVVAVDVTDNNLPMVKMKRNLFDLKKKFCLGPNAHYSIFRISIILLKDKSAS